jgi:hypothetical protein
VTTSLTPFFDPLFETAACVVGVPILVYMLSHAYVLK